MCHSIWRLGHWSQHLSQVTMYQVTFKWPCSEAATCLCTHIEIPYCLFTVDGAAVDGAPEDDGDEVTDWGDGKCSTPLIPVSQTQPFNHPYIQDNVSLY